MKSTNSTYSIRLIIVYSLLMIVLLVSSCDKKSVNSTTLLAPGHGDVNLNGTPYEIADAILFSNYFIYGTGVFTLDSQRQMDATDVNGDDAILGVADFVYFIRKVTGEAEFGAVNKKTQSAMYTYNNNVISTDVEMNAAFIMVTGNVVPTLLADNMEMKYNFDGQATRILVYSTDQNTIFSHDFLNVNGDIVEIEFATYDGSTVKAEKVPGFIYTRLSQNYPNPFDAFTRIYFSVVKASHVSLKIYNANNHVVADYSGEYEVGRYDILWDVHTMANGIYRCTMIVGDYKHTIEMTKVDIQ